MADANPNPTPHGTRRFSIRHWIGLATLLLAVVSCAVSVIPQILFLSDGGVRRIRKNVAELKSGKTKALQLNSVRHTDSLLEQIRGMPEIENVYMEDTDITVVGMRHLGTLPNLKTIVAYNGVAGDEGMLELRNCTKLETLEIHDRRITDHAIAELQRHIPNVRVWTKHDHDAPAQARKQTTPERVDGDGDTSDRRRPPRTYPPQSTEVKTAGNGNLSTSETNAIRESLKPLAAAEAITLYSIDPTGNDIDPDAPVANKPKTGPRFYGYPVLGRADISEKSKRLAVVQALENGIRTAGDAPAECFEPRHAIRVEHNGTNVDYIICFECLQIHIVVGGDQSIELTTAEPQAVLDRYLRGAGIPLAPKPE